MDCAPSVPSFVIVESCMFAVELRIPSSLVPVDDSLPDGVEAASTVVPSDPLRVVIGRSLVWSIAVLSEELGVELETESVAPLFSVEYMPSVPVIVDCSVVALSPSSEDVSTAAVVWTTTLVSSLAMSVVASERPVVYSCCSPVVDSSEEGVVSAPVEGFSWLELLPYTAENRNSFSFLPRFEACNLFCCKKNDLYLMINIKSLHASWW